MRKAKNIEQSIWDNMNKPMNQQHNQNQTTATDAGNVPQREYEGLLLAGNGGWDVTIHPIGGDFIRPSTDLRLSNIRKCEYKLGYFLGDCEYPNRKGIRTIASDRIKYIQEVE